MEGCKAGGNRFQHFWEYFLVNYYYSPFLMEESEVQKISPIQKADSLTFIVSS